MENIVMTEIFPLSTHRLNKTYYSDSGAMVIALEDISLTIETGEFVVIVGPSGCGKSTLLNILAGLEPATSGDIFAYNKPITQPDIERSMVFQNYALFPWLSVRGNVEFGLERRGISRQLRREIAENYLNLVGLTDFADKRIHELSGGMKQRVAIARAFALDPQVILMDEPFGALDALTRRFLQGELLRIWRTNRKTIVFITHSVPEAIYLATRIVVMTARPGRIKTQVIPDLPHPRETTSEAFRELEHDLYLALDEELARGFNFTQ
jgi:NitT/TauT family transport system ATP-binding protein